MAIPRHSLTGEGRSGETVPAFSSKAAAAATGCSLGGVECGLDTPPRLGGVQKPSPHPSRLRPFCIRTQTYQCKRIQGFFYKPPRPGVGFFDPFPSKPQNTQMAADEQVRWWLRLISGPICSLLARSLGCCCLCALQDPWE